MSHVTMPWLCSTRTLANIHALLLGTTQVHPQQLVCMKIPVIEKSVVGGRDVSSWDGRPPKTKAPKISPLSQKVQCLNQDNRVHVQGTVLDSQHLILHFFSYLLSILYNGGQNGGFWKRDTELVTVQGQEPSLTAGQICPAEMYQPRPQSRDWVLWSPEDWISVWMSDARQMQPVGRETQQSPEWVHQHDQSREPVPSRVVLRGMEKPRPWASRSPAMAQAKQCFVASGEEQGVTIRGEKGQQASRTEPESIHKAIMQLSDAIPE